MYKNRKLLITGGTGSFGNEVLSQFLDTDIQEIRIFSRDEKKQDDMRLHYNNSKLKFYLGDIRDYNSINLAMKGVDFVFHAAALKQVPSCEFFPIEAVKTNILGAENVLTSAMENNISKVVVLSTDKAVYPINAMGISKAMMEKLMVAKSRNLHGSGNMFCATRYGNVMGSRGSVIPLFIKQIKEGKNVTVTHPDMTRFMMSLNQSVELVKFAFENAKPGDIFVQKSPASTVLTIAQALIKIFDSPKTAIDVIGIRHGEKMHETLCNAEEMAKSEDMGNFYRIAADNRDLNYSNYLEKGKDTKIFDDYNSSNTERLDLEGTIELLLKLDFVKNQL
ncbi:polysaccharide biosynthesis protein [Niabella sp. CJ426]|uniref:polysaccharide biosynthesis protein n=1 Tax=Niabella sp. CJ426 TaxID=3393740 RepID=UPI003D035AAF